MTGATDSQQKYENYKTQFQRLTKALLNDFNLEAIFIEYAIMEDRTEAILRHADQWEAYLKKCGKRQPNIGTKITHIQKCAENKKAVLHRYFADDLLDKMLDWKNERNRLIHALLKQKLEHGEIKALAEQGYELVTELRNRAGNFNRAIERQKKKENA